MIFFFGVLYKALNLNFIGDNFDYSKSIYFFEKNIISKLLPDELENSKKMIKKVIFEEENEKKKILENPFLPDEAIKADISITLSFIALRKVKMWFGWFISKHNHLFSNFCSNFFVSWYKLLTNHFILSRKNKLSHQRNLSKITKFNVYVFIYEMQYLLQNYMLNIVSYWRNLNFEPHVNIKKKKLSIKMKRQLSLRLKVVKKRLSIRLKVLCYKIKFVCNKLNLNDLNASKKLLKFKFLTKYFSRLNEISSTFKFFRSIRKIKPISIKKKINVFKKHKKVKNLLELYKMTLERYKYAGQICLRSGIYRLGQKETLKK